jgi:CheY-like chemotaxis protein
MAQNGPIVLIEDDPDDIEVYEMIFEEFGLSNRLVIFETAEPALDYLKKTQESPFLIICDINLPSMNGLVLKGVIAMDEMLRKKSIPFVFITTSASKKEIEIAYAETVQGYFVKSDTYDSIKAQLKSILDYWAICRHPNMS